MLLESGASVTITDGEGKTPLHLAVESNSTESVIVLVVEGASVSVSDNNGNTPLHYAARYSSSEIIELLISGGADIHSLNNDGMTPAAIAVANGRVDIFSYLYDGEFDHSESPLLSYAVYNNNINVINFLIEKGEPVIERVMSDILWSENEIIIKSFLNYELFDSSGISYPEAYGLFKGCSKLSLDYLISNKEYDILSELIKSDIIYVENFGKKVTSLDEFEIDDVPFLHYFILKNDVDSICFLIENGVSVFQRNNEGVTAFDFADNLGKEDIVSIFRDFVINNDKN